MSEDKYVNRTIVPLAGAPTPSGKRESRAVARLFAFQIRIRSDQRVTVTVVPTETR
jgi:hypothetical protein